MSRRLGKRLGAVSDPRTVRLRSLVTADAPRPPARHTVALNATFPMYRNDAIGDCGLASQGHRIIAQERSTAQSARVTVTDDDVVAAYSAVSGYDPATGANDTGVYLLDVLRYLRSTGMGTERDGTPHTIYAYAALDPLDHDLVRFAAWLFGGLYVGAGLPLSAADQVDAGEHWHPSGNARRDKWGSWGGHAMYCRGYGPDEVRLVTWGADQFATWEWWDVYVDEAWAIVSEDFLRTRTQLTPQGFDQAALERQLAAL